MILGSSLNCTSFPFFRRLRQTNYLYCFLALAPFWHCPPLIIRSYTLAKISTFPSHTYSNESDIHYFVDVLMHTSIDDLESKHEKNLRTVAVVTPPSTLTKSIGGLACHATSKSGEGNVSFAVLPCVPRENGARHKVGECALSSVPSIMRRN